MESSNGDIKETKMSDLKKKVQDNEYVSENFSADFRVTLNFNEQNEIFSDTKENHAPAEWYVAIHNEIVSWLDGLGFDVKVELQKMWNDKGNDITGEAKVDI